MPNAGHPHADAAGDIGDNPIANTISRILARYVPCTCARRYTEHGWIDPACAYHDAQDAVDDLANLFAAPPAL